MKLRNCIVLIFLSLTLSTHYGQGIGSFKDLKFKNLSVTEGLSQSSVICILQDSKGFMWFGTRDGLNKYDGYTFKKYRFNSQDQSSISNNYISSLYEDKNNNLWVGTNNGLNKYDSERDHFERYSQKNNKIHSELGNEIWSIISAEKNHLWLGTANGLKKFSIKNGVISNYEIFHKNDSSEIFIKDLLKTNDGRLWICSNESVSVYDPKKKTIIYHTYIKNAVSKIPIEVPTIYQDNDKNIWLGCKRGLALFNKKSRVFEQFILQSKTSKISKIIDEVRAIKQGYLGNIWVGTYNGLYIINDKKTSISQYQHDENDSNSLSQNSIFKIFEDSKGDIWIGTYAGGINFYDRSYDLFKNFPAGNNNSKLNYKVISTIIEDPDENLWIGTEGGGINVLDKKTGLFKYYKHNNNDPNSLSTNNVKAIIRTENGNFWIGTHDGGLNFLNPKQLPYKFKKYETSNLNTKTLSSNRIISLHEDDNNNIWIGTSGGGVNVLLKDSESFLRIMDPLERIGKIIYAITKTSTKNVLLISGNKGLVKINTITHKIIPIEFKIKKDSYNTSATLYTFEDSSKNLWIATEGDGLYYYNSTSKKSIKYGKAQGLPSEVVYGVLKDDYDNLWISTNYGISRFNYLSKQFKNFDTFDGLLGNEFNYGSFLKLKNGDLMFGGGNGINYFNPNSIVENAFIPSVLITSILVNNKPYPKKNIDSIELNYDENDFSFNFVALSYSQPNKNQYAYKLEGFDTEWNYIGNKKSATYTNINSGTYIFKIKASNSDGLWNEKGDSITVKVLPAPWRTWWAYLIYLLLLRLTILVIKKYRMLRINERKELKKERREKEKIKEINRMKLQLFTNISHDFRTPLTLIIGPLENMLYKKEGDPYIQLQHEVMHRNASVLLQLVNQLLDFRKSESGKLKLKASENNIIPFIKNIKISFDELAKSKGINYTFIVSNESIITWYDEMNLKKVLYNLLSNAFKFTPNDGEISISVATTTANNKRGIPASFLELIIKDNGKGIPQKNLKYIFDRFYQSEEDENIRSGTGIGLSLTKNIVKLHKGFVKTISKEGEGTSFIVLLPLGKDHLKIKQIVYKSDLDYEDEQVFYSKELNFLIQEKKRNTLFLNDEDESQEITTHESCPTLLLVEDNTEVRSFIKSIFKHNYTIFEAGNGEKAIEIASNHNIDLIISDVMMPKMNGIDLCEKIKSNILTSHIPVILLTAKTSEESQRSGYTTGADAYITKPFDANLLEIRVHNLLKTRIHLIEKFKKDAILEPKQLVATSADELFLQKAIDLIELNIYNTEYLITDFISDMNMSRSVLYKKLKALTDQSITEFIKTIKLKRAGQLLIKSELSISQIAFELGFNDLKHFRVSFQKIFNQLPSQYRANNGLDEL